MRLRTLALGTLLALPAISQITLTVTGPANAVPGATVNVTVSATGTAGKNVSAVQWSHTLPTGYTLAGATVSAGGATLGKNIYCGAATCLDLGFTAANVISNNPITDGALGTVQITVPASAVAGSTPLPITGLFAVDVTGLNVAASSGTAYSLLVLSKCDIDQSGSTNAADVMAMLNGLIGHTTCPYAGSGGCSLANVFSVLLAANGGACNLP